MHIQIQTFTFRDNCIFWQRIWSFQTKICEQKSMSTYTPKRLCRVSNYMNEIFERLYKILTLYILIMSNRMSENMVVCYSIRDLTNKYNAWWICRMVREIIVIYSFRQFKHFKRKGEKGRFSLYCKSCYSDMSFKTCWHRCCHLIKAVT